MRKQRLDKNTPILTEYREHYDDWVDDIPPRPTVKQTLYCSSIGIALVGLLMLATLYW